MNVPHDALFQTFINGSASLNSRVARATDNKSFTRHLLLNYNNFTELFLLTPSTKNCTKGYAPLNKGLPELKSKRTDWLRVRKHQINGLYFEFETVLKFNNLEARVRPGPFSKLRTCRASVGPGPFSEPGLRTRVRPGPFSEIRTGTPNSV